MQPLNYMINMPDPMAAALEGYQTGLQFQGQRQQMGMNAAREARAQELHPIAVAGAQQGLDINASREARAQEAFEMQKQAAAAQQARTAEFNNAMAGLMEKGEAATAQDYAQISLQFPEYGKAVQEAFGALNESQQKNTIQSLGRIASAAKAGEWDIVQKWAADYASAAEASGQDQLAASARALAMLAKASPDAARASIGAMLAGMGADGQKVAEAVFGSGGSDTVQSSVSVGNGRVVVQTMRSGTTRVVDSATGQELTGQQASDAIEQAEAAKAEAEGSVAGARRAETLQADVDLAGQAAAVKGMGAAQVDFVKSAYDGADKTAANIRNIQSAIDAIDDGAKAGVIYNRLPNITKASADLSNALDKMGLDIIGSVTFGALSEGELRLAMETAAPRNLGAAELRAWLSDKLEAQRKVRVALLEQAQFLSDPQNSLNDWIEMVGKGNRASSQEPTPPPPEDQPSEPSYLKYGGSK